METGLFLYNFVNSITYLNQKEKDSLQWENPLYFLLLSYDIDRHYRLYIVM